MPYQGKSVSLAEMLKILISRGLTEATAAIELERAFEDKAIILFLPDGTNDNGEPLYCKMSNAGRSAVVALLRDFPNRMRIPSIRALNAPVELFKAARALRIEFEAACGLSENEEKSVPVPNRRFVSDDKLVAEALDGIRSERWANAHKAAQALAHRAEGASLQSTILRLGGKIRKAMS